MPEGAEGPEVALLDEVPVPAPELAAEPAPPPAPPPEPPPPWANAVDENAMQARATEKEGECSMYSARRAFRHPRLKAPRRAAMPLIGRAAC